TESRVPVLTLEVGAPQKSDLGIETTAHQEMLHLSAVPVGVVIEPELIARIVASHTRIASTRVIRIDVETPGRGVQRVHAEGLTCAGPAVGFVTAGIEHADVAATKQIPLDSQH